MIVVVIYGVHLVKFTTGGLYSSEDEPSDKCSIIGSLIFWIQKEPIGTTIGSSACSALLMLRLYPRSGSPH